MAEKPAELEPLTDNDAAAWDDIEDGAFHSAITVQQLIALDPDNVIEHISKKGVIKLGTFRVQDSTIMRALDERPFLTMGSSDRIGDYEKMWRKHLAKYADKKLKSGWSRRLAVEAFVVNIKDAAAPDKEGLLNPLLLKHDSGACHHSVFSLPALQAVLDFKWNTYAGGWVTAEFTCFLIWLLSFSAFVLVYQDENDSLSLRELLATVKGFIAVGLQLLSCTAMLPFVIIELGSLWNWGLTSWFSAWNLLDCITYILQGLITSTYLGRDVNGWFNVLVAFQCVLLWFRLNYFSRLLGGNGHRFSIVDSMQQVVLDIRTYLIYLMIMLWGFACAYHVLFRRDQEHIKDFSNITSTVITLLGFASKGVDLRMMLGCSYPDAAVLLSLLFQFSTVTVIMSMLTGVMIKSMNKALVDEDMKRMLNKAKAIDELEGTIPSWVERLMPNNYPAYVHVLRLDPDATDDTDTLPDSFLMNPSTRFEASRSVRHRSALGSFYDSDEHNTGGDMLSPLIRTGSLRDRIKRTFTLPANKIATAPSAELSGGPQGQRTSFDASKSGGLQGQRTSLDVPRSPLRSDVSSFALTTVESSAAEALETVREGSVTLGQASDTSSGHELSQLQQQVVASSVQALERQMEAQNRQLNMLELKMMQILDLLQKPDEKQITKPA